MLDCVRVQGMRICFVIFVCIWGNLCTYPYFAEMLEICYIFIMVIILDFLKDAGTEFAGFFLQNCVYSMCKGLEICYISL
jgi:hypothetical protein